MHHRVEFRHAGPRQHLVEAGIGRHHVVHLAGVGYVGDPVFYAVDLEGYLVYIEHAVSRRDEIGHNVPPRLATSACK